MMKFFYLEFLAKERKKKRRKAANNPCKSVTVLGYFQALAMYHSPRNRVQQH